MIVIKMKIIFYFTEPSLMRMGSACINHHEKKHLGKGKKKKVIRTLVTKLHFLPHLRPFDVFIGEIIIIMKE